jgi:hypothetical protein
MPLVELHTPGGNRLAVNSDYIAGIIEDGSRQSYVIFSSGRGSNVVEPFDSLVQWWLGVSGAMPQGQPATNARIPLEDDVYDELGDFEFEDDWLEEPAHPAYPPPPSPGPAAPPAAFLPSGPGYPRRRR